MAGLFLGSSQSAGRALIAYLSPAGCEAEFFSLWGIAVKISSILGPISYGVVVFCNQGDHRQAILFLGLFYQNDGFSFDRIFWSWLARFTHVVVGILSLIHI
mgnify:CR=1 FL=1